MKKHLVRLMILCVLLAVLTVPVFAAGDYPTVGTYGDGISWSYDEATQTLTISGTGEIPDWQEAPWEKTFGPEIKHAVIEEGITRIGRYCFYECGALETVSIPEGVTYIGSQAFLHCESLREIHLPESLTEMGSQVFAGCNTLTEIYIPAALTEMKWPESQFSQCKSLQAIRVSPDNRAYTSDGYGVMFNKEMLMLIAMPRAFSGAYTVPEGVHVIGPNAMVSCEGLTQLTLPLGVTSLQSYALAGCNGLTELVLPISVNVVAEDALLKCKNLQRVELSPNIDKLKRVFTDCTALKEIVLPEGLLSITDKCFAGCTSLTSITVPMSVSKLGDDVFEGCTALTHINVAGGSFSYSSVDGVLFDRFQTTILEYPDGRQGAYAVPATVTDIGTAFKGCAGLTELVLPAGLQTIPEQAFQNCSGLEYLELPAGVTTVEDGAFRNCTALEEIYIADTVETIGRNAFEGCTALKSVYIPDSVTQIGTTCFYNCTALEQIRISPSMKVIPNTLLRGCTAIREAVIPYGAEKMESAVFYECSALERVYLPDTLTFIDCKQTIGCTSLTDVYFTGSQDDWWLLQTEPENTILFGADTHYEAELPAELPAPTPRPVTVVTPTPVPTPTPTPDVPIVPAPVENPFTDVRDSDWYFAPVMWAKSAGVTGGLTETSFGPNVDCTRAQVVTFLWAANGKPEPASMNNPFSDVSDDAWYVKPVLWAVEKGITGGTSPTTFGPDQTCNRAQIVTFLYAAAGKPAVSGSSTFSDVAVTDWYAKSVIWAGENNVTGGIGDGMFGPNNTCTRGQVVTFLYKVYG